MNQVAIASARPPMAADDYGDFLPSWLKYLVAAYPTANVAAGTFAVLEDAFRDETPDVLKLAARACVMEKKFFPTVHEMNYYVRKEHERGDTEQWQLPPHVHYRRMSIHWPVCPDCGERVNPEWVACPACIDLAAMGGGQ